MAHLDSILKTRDIILLTKVHIVKAKVFPVVVHGNESWSTEEAEQWRTDAFELWGWRRCLRVPCTARRSNQSVLKEISPEYSLEGLLLKHSSTLVTRFKKPAHGKRPWCWERLNHSPTQWTWIWAIQEIVKDRGGWCSVVHGVSKSWTCLSNRTATYLSYNWKFVPFDCLHLVPLPHHLFPWKFVYSFLKYNWPSTLWGQCSCSTTEWFGVFYTFRDDRHKSSDDWHDHHDDLSLYKVILIHSYWLYSCTLHFVPMTHIL